MYLYLEENWVVAALNRGVEEGKDGRLTLEDETRVVRYCSRPDTDLRLVGWVYKWLVLNHKALFWYLTGQGRKPNFWNIY
jgi:hypothetical protein